jgi:hypothetical protein
VAPTAPLVGVQPRPLVDFDGDNISDYVVKRNVGGVDTWYILNSQGLSGVPWGISGSDNMTPGDFDGDGKWDLGVWRQSGARTFYIRRSTDLGLTAVQFGQAGDQPRVIADYDGDGRTDFAVVRGSGDGGVLTWYLLQSLAGFAGIVWGLDGDVVAPGDYDGDNKTDLAIRRPSGMTSTYYISRSTGGLLTIPWGLATDTGVSNDYDGDNKTDAAVVRNQGGAFFWYIRRSTDLGLSAYAFGLSTDILTPADYDGDGKTDVAIFRRSMTAGETGFWVLRSGTGTPAFQPFGVFGDTPLANFHVH